MQTHTHHTSHASPASHPAPAPPYAPPSINPLIQPSGVLATAPVPLSALAEFLGATRSTIRHFADRLGFRFSPHRVGARREPRACLTAEQAAAITAAHEADLIAHPPAPKPEPTHAHRDLGHFCLIQLEPEFDPGRFLLGFATDLESRLADLLIIAPMAKLIAAWPAHRSWEHTATVATSQGATPLSQEVFRCENLEDALANANRFFAALPEPAAHPRPHPQTSAAVTPSAGRPRDIGDLAPPGAHGPSRSARVSFVGMTTNTPPRAIAVCESSTPSRAKPISPILPITPIPTTAPPREPGTAPPASPAAQPLWSACASAPLWNRTADG